MDKCKQKQQYAACDLFGKYGYPGCQGYKCSVFLNQVPGDSDRIDNYDC